jgi:hypothetical protein
MTLVGLLWLQQTAEARALQDNGYLSVVQAGKAMFLRESGYITKELIPGSHLKVSFKEPISEVINVQMLESCLALVTKESKSVQVTFYSKNQPARKLGSSIFQMKGNSVFCFAEGDQLVLSDAMKVIIVSQKSPLGRTFDLSPSARARGIPSCAMNNHWLAFAYNLGEWGGFVTSVNIDTREQRLILDSETENLSGSIMDGGKDGFSVIHGRTLLNWREGGRIKNYFLVQEIVSMCPLEDNKLIALSPNGDVFETKIRDLTQTHRVPKLLLSGSDLRRLIYCDGVHLIGVNSQGDLVTLEMNGSGEQPFKLADYQLDNLLELY